jgi:hypothetical protein
MHRQRARTNDLQIAHKAARMALTANNVTTDQVSGSVGERNAETRSYHTSSAVIAAIKERSKKVKTEVAFESLCQVSRRN